MVHRSRKDNDSLTERCNIAMKIMKVDNLKSLKSQAIVAAKHESASDQYTVYLVNLDLCTCSLEMNLLGTSRSRKKDVGEKVLVDKAA